MSAEKHIDRIKKLLRLSKSAEPHEAELAIARAMDLATRHAVDLHSLADDPELGPIIHQWFPLKARLSREWKLAISIAEQYFHVTVCRGHLRVVFVGRADAIAVADYIVTFLVRECRSQVRKFAVKETAARRKMTSGKRAGFIVGFFRGIHSQLAKGLFDLQRQHETLALVLVEEKAQREDHLSNTVGGFTTKPVNANKVRMSNAVVAGFVSGKNTQVNRSLDGHPRNPLCLV